MLQSDNRLRKILSIAMSVVQSLEDHIFSEGVVGNVVRFGAGRVQESDRFGFESVKESVDASFDQGRVFLVDWAL